MSKIVDPNTIPEFHYGLKLLIEKLIRHLYVDVGTDLWDSKKEGDVITFICSQLRIKRDFKDARELLRSLSNSQLLILIRIIMGDPRFQKMSNDNWNYRGDYIKSWPVELISALKTYNVEFDPQSTTFIYNNDSSLVVNGTSGKNQFLEYPFDDLFYDSLRKELNVSYDANLPTACFVLCRKIVENLLIDILRKKFNSGADVQIYYDTSNRRFRDLYSLINELKTRKGSFVADESLIDSVIPRINELRDSANSAVHSIVAMNGIDELDSLHFPSQIEILKRILNNLP